mgnify:CR=1 FL=1
MRHNNKNKILKRKAGKRRALLNGIARSLVLYGKIETTRAKAKAVRPTIEKMITIAKIGGLSGRRRVIVSLGLTATKRLFETIAPRYSERSGGYTRILKKSASRSDNSAMVIMELV